MTKKYKALDLYCCCGGGSKGLSNAGFEVTGVDFDPKVEKNYPFTFIHGSVLDLTVDFIREFDFVGSSPPCQGHTDLKHRTGITYLDLIPETRALLDEAGVPYYIENVVSHTDKHLKEPLLLCGTMFGLGANCRDGQYRQLWRHRLFETNFSVTSPGPCKHEGQPIGVYGDGGGGPQTRGYKAFPEEGREALGIDWYMARKYTSQAIPPAYSEWIANEWLRQQGDSNAES